MKHLMIDIETLATGYNPCIATIGLCWFDPQMNAVADPQTLRCNVTPDNGTLEHRTVLWWLGQSRDAVDSTFFSGERIPLREALDEVLRQTEQADKVWAKGTDFDLRIINEVCEHHGLGRAVAFWKFRDCRNLYDMLGKYLPARRDRMVAHDAGWDAYYQALVVCEAYRRFNAAT